MKTLEDAAAFISAPTLQELVDEVSVEDVLGPKHAGKDCEKEVGILIYNIVFIVINYSNIPLFNREPQLYERVCLSVRESMGL